MGLVSLREAFPKPCQIHFSMVDFPPPYRHGNQLHDSHSSVNREQGHQKHCYRTPASPPPGHSTGGCVALRQRE